MKLFGWAQLVWLLGVCACGPLSYTVDRGVLDQLTVENKLLLFDAENGVSIAIDEKEIIQREIRQLKEDIRDAKRQVREAESDAERASEKGDDKREQLSDLAGDVYQLKIDFLKMEIWHHRRRLKGQEGLILVALARYELAKAQLAKQNNLPGSEDIEIEVFEGQVDDYVASAQEDQQDLKEDYEEVEEAKSEWLEARSKLNKASGGGLGSPWSEEGSIWSL